MFLLAAVIWSPGFLYDCSQIYIDFYNLAPLSFGKLKNTQIQILKETLKGIFL